MIKKQEEAWKDKDVDGIVGSMTDDGMWMLPGMDIVNGKEGMKCSWFVGCFLKLASLPGLLELFVTD